MGQKINPTGFRVGVIRDWDAKWYADKDFADYLHEDIEIRNFINKSCKMLQYHVLKLNVLQSASTFPFILLNRVWLSVKAVLKLKTCASSSIS